MYRRVHGVELDPEREVLPLLGSKEGIFHLGLAFIGPGDAALAPDPGYVTYRRGAAFAGGEVYPVPLLPERDYLPDLDALPPEALRRAKILWLNYPNNPTAAVATRQFFAQAVDFAREHRLLLCHDAAYAQVSFDGGAQPSLLEAPGAKEVAVEFNSLSKSHNMAGWRVGALVGNAQVVSALYRLKTNADSGHFRPVLEAAEAALSGDQGWLQERNRVYQGRRDAVVEGLRGLGWTVRAPKAGLYVWSPLPAGWDCETFVVEALEKAHVSLTPGTVFGPGGAGHIRIALTAPEARLGQAMECLKEWLG
jgi:LL-diaminopimelate aminotransferase